MTSVVSEPRVPCACGGGPIRMPHGFNVHYGNVIRAGRVCVCVRPSVIACAELYAPPFRFGFRYLFTARTLHKLSIHVVFLVNQPRRLSGTVVRQRIRHIGLDSTLVVDAARARVTIRACGMHALPASSPLSAAALSVWKHADISILTSATVARCALARAAAAPAQGSSARRACPAAGVTNWLPPSPCGVPRPLPLGEGDPPLPLPLPKSPGEPSSAPGGSLSSSNSKN